MSKPDIVSGPTDVNDADTKRDVLESYIGNTIEVKLPGEKPFAGTLKNIDPVTTDGMHEDLIGLELTVEKRKMGGTVTFSTSFKDDDFDGSSYIRDF